MRALAIIGCALLLVGATCRPSPTPPPQPATGGGSTGGESTSGGSSGGTSTGGLLGTGGITNLTPCEWACLRLAELGCEAARPTEAGTDCAHVCENVNASGTLRLDTECVMRSVSCEAADRCVR